MLNAVYVETFEMGEHTPSKRLFRGAAKYCRFLGRSLDKLCVVLREEIPVQSWPESHEVDIIAGGALKHMRVTFLGMRLAYNNVDGVVEFLR